MNFIQKILVLLTCSIILLSCQKTLDINYDPTSPKEVTPEVSFPSGTMFLAAAIGGDMQLIGSIWAQHYAQGNTSNQYRNIDEYNLSNNNYNNIWSLLYAGAIPDLDKTIQVAQKNEQWNYWFAATIMKTFTFHIITDLYGNVPFKKANMGVDNFTPVLDDSRDVIYPGLIEMLNMALDKINDAKSSKLTSMGASDFIFNGDMSKWEQFAYTLKLKILMRDFNKYQSDINSLLSLTPSPFLTADAKVNVFTDLPDKSNPLYENDQRKLNTSANLRASETMVSYLKQFNDPRIEYFYKKGTILPADASIGKSKSDYVGIPQGSAAITGTRDTYSQALLKATDPVYFISLAETHFMVAECYTRKPDFPNAKKWYEQGVKNAFERWGLDATLPNDFIGTGKAYELKNDATQLTTILTQKWIASVRCQGLNAFFDINRTQIPALGTLQISNKRSYINKLGANLTLPDGGAQNTGYIVGTLTPSVGSVLGTGLYPKRMLYPKRASDYNPNASEAKQIPITQKLWWQPL